MSVRLGGVADLTLGSQRRLVRITVQELTGDWRGYALRNPNRVRHPPYYASVPAQRLGAALRAIRWIEGFVTYSARVPTRKTLVVFPDRLRRGSQIRFTDPATGHAQSIP